MFVGICLDFYLSEGLLKNFFSNPRSPRPLFLVDFLLMFTKLNSFDAVLCKEEA